MDTTMTSATMIAQVESLPDLIRNEFDRLDDIRQIGLELRGKVHIEHGRSPVW